MRKLLFKLSVLKKHVPLASMIACAVLGVMLAGLLASCDREGGMFNTSGGGLWQSHTATVPTLRVKLSSPGGAVRISTTGAFRIKADSRAVCQSQTALSPADFTYTGGGWNLSYAGAGSVAATYPGRELTFEPLGDSKILLGQTCYRGSIHLAPQSTGTFLVINYVDLESYIAGVLPKELLPRWSYETYRSLAVAARTFAVYQKSTFGPTHEYDVGDGESSQCYGGYTAETITPFARRAVDSTRSQVLAYPQNGRMRIFLAQYSASCGGVVNGAYVIREAPLDRPIAGGQACTDCMACPHFYWGPVRAGKSELLAALQARYPSAAGMGSINTINVVSQTPWGRAVWVDVVGASGKTLRLRAEDIRLAWNMSLSGKPDASRRRLYSMNCTIRVNADSVDFVDGHGFGHGVGLCQWGAQGKALAGWKAEQILGFYYPGASIIRAY